MCLLLFSCNSNGWFCGGIEDAWPTFRIPSVIQSFIFEHRWNVLDNRDSQWQKLTYLAPSKTCHVSDVDASYRSYVRFLHVAH